MPRYFFQVADGTDLPDVDGEELTDLAAAKCHAVKYAGDLICEQASTFWDRNDWQMTVSDEAGLTLFTLMFIGHEAPVIKR